MADVPIDLILTLATTVVKMAMNTKDNQERCRRVGKRVTALHELVLKLKQRDPALLPEVVRSALYGLSATLVQARNAMQKYQRCGRVKSFVMNGAHEDMFAKIHERLDDTFQVLSGALQLEQGDKLDRVLEAVTARRGDPTWDPAGVFHLSSAPPDAPSPVPQSPTATTPASNTPPIVPAITVTRAPNPPYPPAPNPPYPPAHRPAYNPNALTVPAVRVAVPCAMPPRVVARAPPPPAQPVYGTLPPRLVATVTSGVMATAPPVVYAQAPPPQPVIVTVNQPRPVFHGPGVVTVVMTRRLQ